MAEYCIYLVAVSHIHMEFDGGVFKHRFSRTIGAAFAAKQVESRGKKITLGIWDTAGSERYEAMSRIYYRGAKAAVVCFDVSNRASWDRAKFWVGELRRHEEACKVYLCGTKRDLSSSGQRRVTCEHAAKYAEGIQATYLETSSKTGENVGLLFQQIADDFLAVPENVRQVEETLTLECPSTKKSHCCYSSS
ncbi:ras-related protein Rab-24-like isoform X2 [Bacillus rossius redtenbacheri]|uniref:ras-related protein Rab-24-like isoform X2 n=1 Tax=Bacillus rossius redtenbacheri TaxID=93214 RepID=UPI002FDEBEF4